VPRPRKKIKMTWAQLRLERSALERFEVFLPLLQLKQQQLQAAILEAGRDFQAMKETLEAFDQKILAYRAVFKHIAGINIAALSKPEDIKTVSTNVAGVRVPAFESARFPKAVYSLFGTPAWVDRALSDQREKNLNQVKLEILKDKLTLLQSELKKVTQRVNLFEKIIIPETKENIRRIRIALSDRMTAAVARAKMAKEKMKKQKKENRLECESI
jgi:V/A-type H+/Na+-transporting ATPase subunit D